MKRKKLSPSYKCAREFHEFCEVGSRPKGSYKTGGSTDTSESDSYLEKREYRCRESCSLGLQFDCIFRFLVVFAHHLTVHHESVNSSHAAIMMALRGCYSW